jgi:hypothetical protein
LIANNLAAFFFRPKLPSLKQWKDVAAYETCLPRSMAIMEQQEQVLAVATNEDHKLLLQKEEEVSLRHHSVFFRIIAPKESNLSS